MTGQWEGQEEEQGRVEEVEEEGKVVEEEEGGRVERCGVKEEEEEVEAEDEGKLAIVT